MNWKVILIALAITVLGGCRTAPIYNVVDSPVVVAAGKPPTMDNVKDAIVRAGAALGWKMTPGEPGRVNGQLYLRDHVAIVEVKFDTKTFSITYVNSTNLDYRNGQIHKNYNGWVENLDRGIRAELMKA